jgi:cation diffusion facilitator family transporter
MTDTASQNYKLIRKVTLVGSVIDGLLSILKIAVGLIGQSQAMIADGVHSLSDLATDLLVIWAARHAKEGPDEKHPYGHERIETLATMVLSVALIAIALGFGYDGVLRILNPDELQQPGWLVLIAAGISMLAKEAIYHYTIRAAEKINSNLLRANAWHSRSDAASSLIVLLGVVGVMLGFEYADALALIGVSIMIGWIGWELGRDGIEELIDTSIDADILEQMLETIATVEGVLDVHQTRTRKMASKIIMDTHITVNSTITVSEGHRIGDAVERALHQQFKDLSDITVHIDHEDDALERPGYDLPLRSVVLADISHALKPNSNASGGLSLDDFTEIKLHYLDSKIQLELWRDLPTEGGTLPAQSLEEDLRKRLMKADYISNVEFLYRSMRPSDLAVLEQN